jgi:hypothetical protein
LERGYDSGMFATHKHWASFGAQMRKDEVASPIVFFHADLGCHSAVS